MSSSPHDHTRYETGRGLAIAAVAAAVVAVLSLLLLPFVTGTATRVTDAEASPTVSQVTTSTTSPDKAGIGPVVVLSTSHPRLGTVVRRTTSHPRLGPVVRHSGESAPATTATTS